MFLLPFSAFFSDTYFTYLEHRAFTHRYTELFPSGAQSFFPGKQSPLQCKYKFIYPDFLGEGKSIFWA